MSSGQQKQAERWDLSLNVRMSLLKAVMDPQIDMPRRESDSSSSGDEQSYLPVHKLSSSMTKKQYRKGAEVTSRDLPSAIQKLLIDNVQQVKNKQ